MTGTLYFVSASPDRIGPLADGEGIDAFESHEAAQQHLDRVVDAHRVLGLPAPTLHVVRAEVEYL